MIPNPTTPTASPAAFEVLIHEHETNRTETYRAATSSEALGFVMQARQEHDAQNTEHWDGETLRGYGWRGEDWTVTLRELSRDFTLPEAYPDECARFRRELARELWAIRRSALRRGYRSADEQRRAETYRESQTLRPNPRRRRDLSAEQARFTAELEGADAGAARRGDDAYLSRHRAHLRHVIALLGKLIPQAIG